MVIIESRNQRVQPVRDHHLLEQAPQNPDASVPQVLALQAFAAYQLIRGVLIPRDRAFHCLREETKKKRKLYEIPLRLDPLPLDFEQISGSFQRIVGNTDRNRDLQNIKGLHRMRDADGINGLCGKTTVFDGKENSEQNEDAKGGKPRSPCLTCLRRFALFLSSHPKTENINKDTRQNQIEYKETAKKEEVSPAESQQSVFAMFFRRKLV